MTDKATTIGVLVSSVMVTGVYGLISGLAWSFSLGSGYATGLFYGGIIGALVGLVSFAFQRTIAARGRINHKEAAFTAGSMLSILFFASIVFAVVIGIVRWIFF